MALWDKVQQFLSLQPMLETRSIDTFDETSDMATQLAAIHARARPWRLPSISEALGVPAIQRAVTLIANTVGSLAIVGYQNGRVMSETPRLVVRPDPFETPDQTYTDIAWGMATRGESVLWIAARERNGTPSALILVPSAELKVEENQRNRLYPIYTWGKIRGDRYSPANPDGAFVHIFYSRDNRFSLRGLGPLQRAGAAASVSVEAQEWAANFYAGGGYPSIELHSEIELDATESEALKAQWVNTPSNMPKVTSGPLTAKEIAANPQGAQMLEAREYNNGDAARLYGIPGSLLEYSSPGSSLTYQNLEGEYTKFVRTCLAPNYLEKIEQSLSDLLPRSVIVRFSVDGLQRADIKTRFEVYKAGIESGVLTPELAQVREGIISGDIESAPVPKSPPLALPPAIERRSGPVRCDGTRLLRGRLTTCNKLLAEAGPFTGTCPRCDKAYVSEPVTERTMARIPAQRLATRAPAAEPDLELRDVVVALAQSQIAQMSREPATPMIAPGAIVIHNAPPVVTVTTPIEPGAVVVNVPETPVSLTLSAPEPAEQRMDYDEQGRLVSLRIVKEDVA